MIKYDLAERKDAEKISKFIAKLNKDKENHIGYCGDDAEEIQNSLMEDMDIPFEKSFIIASENDKIIGALGFDADMEKGNAEIWGPFIEKSGWNIAHEMWNRMMQLLPKKIKLVSMFIDKENKNCFDLAMNLGFCKKSEENIMIFERKYIDKIDNALPAQITADDYEDMEQLHDKVFPHTYYSGEDIIKRLNINRKVFIQKENDKLEGYIYAEAEPEFGEGSIEFLAVNSFQRGRGIGYKLLCMALKWIFSFESINSVTLCVNSENNAALNLYNRAGLKEKDLLCCLTKSID